MPVAETSKDAYQQIVEEGVERSQAGRLCVFINRTGQNLTRLQISEMTGIRLSSVTAPVNKLLEEGKIAEYGAGKCPLSGRPAKVVGPLPKTRQGELAL